VATPVIDGLVALSSAMLGRDFAREGRSLEHLGLAGRTPDEVRRVFELGPTA
jgi:opine dehydrogenase